MGSPAALERGDAGGRGPRGGAGGGVGWRGGGRRLGSMALLRARFGWAAGRCGRGGARGCQPGGLACGQCQPGGGLWPKSASRVRAWRRSSWYRRGLWSERLGLGGAVPGEVRGGRGWGVGARWLGWPDGGVGRGGRWRGARRAVVRQVGCAGCLGRGWGRGWAEVLGGGPGGAVRVSGCMALLRADCVGRVAARGVAARVGFSGCSGLLPADWLGRWRGGVRRLGRLFWRRGRGRWPGARGLGRRPRRGRPGARRRGRVRVRLRGGAGGARGWVWRGVSGCRVAAAGSRRAGWRGGSAASSSGPSARRVAMSGGR